MVKLLEGRDLSCIDVHVKEYKTQPEVVVEVPGVITFLGEFADYCGGYALCGTSNQSLFIAVSRRMDNTVRIFNSLTGDHKHFSLSSMKFRKEDRWANYVKGILSGFSGYSKAIPGLDITLYGSLLTADGKNLSCATSIGTYLVLKQLVGLDLDENVVVRCCFVSCSQFCGEICSTSMLYTMLKSKEDNFMMYDNHTMTHRYYSSPFTGSPYVALLVDSCIPPLAMREELVHKHREIKEAMQKLRQFYPHGSFRDFPVSELRERIIPLDEETRTLCSFALDESQASASFDRLFKLKDFLQMGKTFSRVAQGLRDDMELTCPELDWLMKRASEVNGCYGSCMIHAGDSGVVLLVINEKAVDSYMAKLDDYERIFGFKAKVCAYSSRNGASYCV